MVSSQCWFSRSMKPPVLYDFMGVVARHLCPYSWRLCRLQNAVSQSIALLIMFPATFCAGMTLPLLIAFRSIVEDH